MSAWTWVSRVPRSTCWVTDVTAAVEALAAERVLVLVLEDLHWSDPSTVDVLNYLARRRWVDAILAANVCPAG